MKNNLRYLLLTLIIAITASCSESEQPVTRLKLATTTSVENSGLLSYLLPEFEKEFNYKIDVIAVGTGKALKLARQGDIDAVLVHDPKLEEKFIADGFGVDRRPIMTNDFFIVGPADNPAGLKIADPAQFALQKIAGTPSIFISRGDESGTHQKEKFLWELIPLKPLGKWHLESGQGMGATLIIANEKKAYCLTDRATYLSFKKKIELLILCRGDTQLINPYSITTVNPARFPNVKYEAATKLINWLTSPAAQKMIGNFKQQGEVLFDPVMQEK
ncbi:MAG: substrate-binding domain-containing protein [Planctomycetota bacterium]